MISLIKLICCSDYFNLFESALKAYIRLFLYSLWAFRYVEQFFLVVCFFSFVISTLSLQTSGIGNFCTYVHLVRPSLFFSVKCRLTDPNF